jgi:nicotinate-nucleotide pyrophosphorylase (carboxylating)
MKKIFPLPDSLIDEHLHRFLLEDEGYGDITSVLLVSKAQQAKAKLFTREPCIISGTVLLPKLFPEPSCSVEIHVTDGDSLKKNQAIATISGSMREILLKERLALNLLSRMSGIATKTHLFSQEIPSKSNTVIAATRKTTPGMRLFEKYAVACGGGDSHRYRLDDMVLIKDNHRVLYPSIQEAVTRVKEHLSFSKKIEVEVEDNKTMIAAAEAGADIIMLDNRTPKEIKEAFALLEEKGLREKVLIELSGGITKENIKKYAQLGADVISSGSLTHSYRSIDLSLEITSLKK